MYSNCDCTCRTGAQSWNLTPGIYQFALWNDPEPIFFLFLFFFLFIECLALSKEYVQAQKYLK